MKRVLLLYAALLSCAIALGLPAEQQHLATRVDPFFVDNGDIVGISIEVSDVDKAPFWVEGHSGHKLTPYKGFYGRSILIPPDLTHGVWMELSQR